MNLPTISTVVSYLVLGTCSNTAHAILFMSTSDPLFNSTAPSGAYADSGWQYEGAFGQILGTAISSDRFITAAHGGFQSPVFVYGGVSYPVVSRSIIPGTDLMIAQVSGTFKQWAPLYTGSNEIGSEIVMMGRGGPRGSAILGDDGAELGWQTTPSDGVIRWGTNTVDDLIALNGIGGLMVATFGNNPGDDEAGLGLNDSGGGVFLDDGGIWKLAGITYGADSFAIDPTGAGNFTAALFDPDGFYRYDDKTGYWNEQTGQDPGTRYYFSQISSSAQSIMQLAQIPEPATAAMLALACGGCFLRKRSIA